jgi:hypothetical protein
MNIRLILALFFSFSIYGGIMKIRRLLILPAGLLALAVLACNFPFLGAPTEAVFPTPDLTMTAVFNPSPSVPTATALIPTQPAPSPTTPPTIFIPTWTPTLVPSPTATATNPPPPPPPPPTPTTSYVGPGSRPKFSLPAQFMDNPPEIDGELDDWDFDRYPIEYVVFGGQNWKGADDLSGRAMLGWDDDYLYLAVRVLDDVYAQNAAEENLFKGDSLEILLDVDVSSDYYYGALSADDYQIGLSPGSPDPGEDPEAYLWFPRSLEGTPRKVAIGARSREDGYIIEAAIPWFTFNVDPSKGQHFGFCLSISDNDNRDKNEQQSMVSSALTRQLSDPMTWGDLTLIR